MYKLTGKDSAGPVTVTARYGYDGDVIVLFEMAWGVTEVDKSQDEAWDLFRRLLGEGYIVVS